MNKNKMISGSLINVFISIFDKAAAFAAIPVFTRLMTTEDYGMYSTYIVWAGIAEHIIGLSAEYSFRTAYYDWGGRYDEYCSAVFSLSALIAGGIISLAAAVCGLFKIAGANIAVMCLVHSYALFLGSCLDFKATIEQNYKGKAFARVLPALSGLAVSVILVVLSKNGTFAARVYGTAAGYGAAVLIPVLKIVGSKKVFCNKRFWKYSVAVSAPLILHGLSNIVLAGSDRIMLSAMRSNTEAGIYGIAHSFGLIGLALMTAFESVWIPWFSGHLQNGAKDTVNKGCGFYLITGSVCFAGVMLAGPDIIGLLVPAEYSYARVLLMPTAFGAYLTFLYSISVDLEIYLKSTAKIAGNTAAAAILNIVLNFALINGYGMAGAAAASVISYFVLFVLHCMNARRLEKELFPVKIYAAPFIAVSAASALGIFFTDNAVLRWIALAVIIIIGSASAYRSIPKDRLFSGK